MRTGIDFDDYNLDESLDYTAALSALFKSQSKKLIMAAADGGNHFTHYGIAEGTQIVFDGELPFEAGKLSLFENKQGCPKLKLSLAAEPGMEHIGRAIARINFFEN